MGIFGNSSRSNGQKFSVGDMVMIRWRGQVGIIQEYDARSNQYLVKPVDKGYAELYDEGELTRNY